MINNTYDELLLKYPVGSTVFAIKSQNNSFSEQVITIGKKYSVLDHIYLNYRKISVLNDDGVGIYYSIDDFLTLADYREHQLNKLLSHK